VVGVIRNDLYDLLNLDFISVFLFGVGNFFLSGALWLLIEKLFETPTQIEMILFCGLSAVFGAILLIVGWRLHAMKRSKIENIMNQSDEYTVEN